MPTTKIACAIAEPFIAVLQAAIEKRERAGLLAALEAANVPAGPIYTIGEAFADPQVIARRMRLDLPATGARGGTAPAVRSPIVLDGEAFAAATAAPRLGEQTEQVLTELGLEKVEIAALRVRGRGLKADATAVLQPRGLTLRQRCRGGS